ncbi:hypothetical protein TrLO_g1661 [Triparma laevis f. longispina]|nr:hypothetical protein TrLO_g1661 [Triparma laevis f. longispina]
MVGEGIEGKEYLGVFMEYVVGGRSRGDNNNNSNNSNNSERGETTYVGDEEFERRMEEVRRKRNEIGVSSESATSTSTTTSIPNISSTSESTIQTTTTPMGTTITQPLPTSRTQQLATLSSYTNSLDYGPHLRPLHTYMTGQLHTLLTIDLHHVSLLKFVNELTIIYVGGRYIFFLVFTFDMIFFLKSYFIDLNNVETLNTDYDLSPSSQPSPSMLVLLFPPRILDYVSRSNKALKSIGKMLTYSRTITTTNHSLKLALNVAKVGGKIATLYSVGWLAGTIGLISELNSGELIEELNSVVKLGGEVKKEIEGMDEEGVDFGGVVGRVVEGGKVVGGKGWIWGKEEEVDDGRLLEVIAEMYGEGVLGEGEKKRMIEMVVSGNGDGVRKTLEMIEMEENANEGGGSPGIPDPDDDERGWDCLKGDLIIQDEEEVEEEVVREQPISPKEKKFASAKKSNEDDTVNGCDDDGDDDDMVPIENVEPVQSTTTTTFPTDPDSDSEMIAITTTPTTPTTDTTSLTEWVETVEEEFSGSTSTYVNPESSKSKKENEEVTETEETTSGGWGKFVGGALLGAGAVLLATAGGGGKKSDEDKDKKKDEIKEEEKNPS